MQQTLTRSPRKRRRRPPRPTTRSAPPKSSASTCSGRAPDLICRRVRRRVVENATPHAANPCMPDTSSFPLLRRRLLKWFDRNQRDLPWRRDRDPYRIWVSEVMLQQTTVAMATPRFERFIQQFPSVADL